jgi:cation transport ATPase
MIPGIGGAEVLSRLEGRGTDVVVLTGDHEAATGFRRRHDAVSHAFAGISPEGKAEAIH